uniref:Putative secreted peptide n=1 Tax=Anopheles braziliensis TaxID=58242 RepID=A0A2M3ZTI9_9DIPT
MFWFALLVAFRFWRFQWTKNAFRLIFLRSFDSRSFFGRRRVEKGSVGVDTFSFFWRARMPPAKFMQSNPSLEKEKRTNATKQNEELRASQPVTAAAERKNTFRRH